VSKGWLHIAIAYVMLCSSAGAEEVTDPAQHFLAGLSREPRCLWRIQADLDADQLPEEMLTFDKNRNGRAGHIWQVYIGTSGGFVVASDLITFRTDAAFIGPIHEINEPGLLTYFPGSSSQGALVAFQVRQGQLIKRNLGQIRPYGSDATLYQQYFSLSKIVVEKKSIFGGECAEI